MQPRRNPFSFLVFFFLVSSTIVFGQQQSVSYPVKNAPLPNTARGAIRAVYTFNVLTGKNNTYGYDILKNGALSLHQPAEVFTMQQTPLTSAIQARRAAMFVIFKMKNNIRPATLTKAELAKVTIN
jgi:hypothetical protein